MNSFDAAKSISESLRKLKFLKIFVKIEVIFYIDYLGYAIIASETQNFRHLYSNKTMSCSIRTFSYRIDNNDEIRLNKIE